MMPTRTNARPDGDLRQDIRGPLEAWQEHGAAELSEVLTGFLADETQPDRPIRIERLKRAVYRLHIGRSGRSLVLKRHTPALAQVDRLLVERWLPAIDFADRCPRLLCSAADREGSCVWHVYEDLGAARAHASSIGTTWAQVRSPMICPRSSINAPSTSGRGSWSAIVKRWNTPAGVFPTIPNSTSSFTPRKSRVTRTASSGLPWRW